MVMRRGDDSDLKDKMSKKNKELTEYLDEIKVFKTDSAQSSSNKCKNYLLKNYAQHINFFNTI